MHPWVWAWGTFLMAWGLGGCGVHRPTASKLPVGPAAPARSTPVPSPAQDDILREAQRRFQEARQAVQDERYDQAKLAFDEAAVLLLQVPPDSPLYAQAQALLEEIMRMTVELEQGLQAQGIALSESYEPAIIDQVKDIHVFVSKEEVDVVQTWLGQTAVQFDLPLRLDATAVQAVTEMIKAFQTVRRSEFERGLQRMPLLLEFYRQQFAQAGLPQDLAYLALIESGFNPFARSRAGAKGVWQFILGTARRYGLQVNWWLDERSDIVRSGEAAIAYLKDLYAMFGDWWLALAAYNVGEGRIAWAIERAGVQDFWVIRRMGLIPAETRNYVPAFIAALVIAKHPERFGFEVPSAPPLTWEEVPARGGVRLATVAQAAGIPYEPLRFLNASLRREYIPVGVSHVLRVPKDVGTRLVQVLERIPRTTVEDVLIYRVRHRDTLHRVARRFGVSVKQLAEWNGLSPTEAHLRPGQVLRIPRGPDKPDLRGRPLASRTSTTTYRVRPGDTLYRIAQRLGVSVEVLRRMNPGVSPHRLSVGQVLRVPVPSATLGASGAVVHQVRPGETLFRIARLYGVPLERLLEYNGLSSDAPIRPGDVLRIPPKEGYDANSGT
ncbi:MAG: LysM peptidoglycan-binding domain-containing protein [Acidobacteria bacterium]|nr:LysM peptidoglycan-binding domain-containing protein [Acidobacteriota bacterium]MDW7983828.1 LysM peptidoglycan-binding domain-containing protein [Acidobacteriota bacterium]